MLVEAVLPMLTLVCQFKEVRHLGWDYFETRLTFAMAMFNLLVRWEDLPPDDNGFVPLSIAQFSL